MTPEERAEKILSKQTLYRCTSDDPHRDIVALIAAEIRAAVEEAIWEHHSINNPVVSKILQKRAYEDAAKRVRQTCRESACENRCYHEHAILARAKKEIE